MASPKILIILTSHEVLGSTGKKTGFWLEELAIPYNVFKAAGAEITLASPKGGKPPQDPRSDKPSDEVEAFLADSNAVRKLETTSRVSELKQPFDAILVAGGHGAMWDLPTHPAVAERLTRTWAAGGVVAAVCHGPAALVGAKNAAGEPLVRGKNLTSFSDEEERASELDEVVPFLLEAKLSALGGFYSQVEKFQPHVVRDGHLITGQNPASSRGVAEQVLAALAKG